MAVSLRDDSENRRKKKAATEDVEAFKKGLRGGAFEWDVFLSHSSVDKPRVARLAERLTQAGFRVWFDRPNIESGEDIVMAIEHGLERSRVLILCMTKSALESEWVRSNATRPCSATRPTTTAASFRCDSKTARSRRCFGD